MCILVNNLYNFIKFEEMILVLCINLCVLLKKIRLHKIKKKKTKTVYMYTLFLI